MSVRDRAAAGTLFEEPHVLFGESSRWQALERKCQGWPPDEEIGRIMEEALRYGRAWAQAVHDFPYQFVSHLFPDADPHLVLKAFRLAVTIYEPTNDKLLAELLGPLLGRPVERAEAASWASAFVAAYRELARI